MELLPTSSSVTLIGHILNYTISIFSELFSPIKACSQVQRFIYLYQETIEASYQDTHQVSRATMGNKASKFAPETWFTDVNGHYLFPCHLCFPGSPGSVSVLTWSAFTEHLNEVHPGSSLTCCNEKMDTLEQLERHIKLTCTRKAVRYASKCSFVCYEI